MLSAVGIVLGAIVLLRVGLRRLGLAPPSSGTRSLRVMESCALGPRQRLHVIDVEGERLLIAAAEGRVTLLRRLGAGAPLRTPSEESHARRRSLRELRVEVRRTSTPDYHDRLAEEERMVAALLARVREGEG